MGSCPIKEHSHTRMKLQILLCAFLAPAAFAAEAVKPNVLLIAVDDLKPLMGCYGDPLAKTPNLDRLAKRGVLFERAYTNQAVCSPSRNALLTGLRPQTTGIYDLGTNFRRANPDAVTLPQHFQKHGYRTEALGKLFHVGHGNREDAASWTVPHFQAKTVQYVLPENKAELTREEAFFENKAADVSKLPRGAAYEMADVPDSTYADGLLADETIKRLRAAKEKANEPWFIALGFLKPHLPFCAPKKYWDLYERSSFQLPSLRTPPTGAPNYAPTNWGELRNYKDIPNRGALSDDESRALIHAYYACISYMDAQLGRVLDAVDEMGLAKDTIIVLWGDHGYHLGDHGQWCKHTNYEQATRIPLMIAAPGVEGGKRTNALVENVDLYPTLAELAGLAKPTEGEGLSLVPVLRAPESAKVREAAIQVYPRGDKIGRALRTDRYRFVEWKVPGAAADTAEFELYDMQADPIESRNLASEQPEVIAKMKAILATHPEAKPQFRGNQGAPARAAVDRKTLFLRRDANKDGKLTRAEFMQGQPDPEEAPKRFDRFDVDKSGDLSEEEFVSSGNPRK
jgi:iduronate 2-sulfatase